MNNKINKFISLFIILIIIIISTFIYLNRDLIIKDKEIVNDNNVVEKDDTSLEIQDSIKEEINDDELTEDEFEENTVLEDTNKDSETNNSSSGNNKSDDSIATNKPSSNNNSSSNKSDDSADTTKPSNNTSENKNNSNNEPDDSTNKPSSNDNSSNSNNNNIDNSDDGNTGNNDIQEDIIETTPTLEQLNNEHRNELQSTYGVKIAYGEEMGNYLVGYYLPTKMNDASTINEYLGRIETELKKYPNGFFKEMKDYGMPLTIYLVTDIPNSSISGFTDSQIYSNIILTVKESLLFETTLNHELMHYIDAYLNSKLYPNSVDVAWNLLNPPDYTYGSFDASYDYFPNQNVNAYFFSNYAQTNYKEDRATLFGDLMTRVVKRNCYSEGYPLYSKLKLIAEQIDEGFDCVNSSTTEYWEKFI